MEPLAFVTPTTVKLAPSTRTVWPTRVLAGEEVRRRPSARGRRRGGACVTSWVVNIAPDGDLVVARRGVGGRRADERRRRVARRAGDERRAVGVDDRRGALDVGRVERVLQRGGVLRRQRRRRRRRRRRKPPGPPAPNCAWTMSTLEPSASMPRLDLALGAVADGDEHDHRGDADRHAEDRQARAQLVGRDPRRARCAASRRASCRLRLAATGRSLDARGRRRAGRSRCARAATSGSCVMRTTVRPSPLRRSKMSRTSAVERESRLPVGSSARISDGFVTIARAIATRCCWPPESSDGTWSSAVARGRPRRARRSRGARRSARPTPGVGQRQLDVRQRARARHEVEALEDEADLAVAQVGELVLVDVAHVDAVEQVAPGGRRVEAAEDVHQRATCRCPSCP